MMVCTNGIYIWSLVTDVFLLLRLTFLERVRDNNEAKLLKKKKDYSSLNTPLDWGEITRKPIGPCINVLKIPRSYMTKQNWSQQINDFIKPNTANSRCLKENNISSYTDSLVSDIKDRISSALNTFICSFSPLTWIILILSDSHRRKLYRSPSFSLQRFFFN